MDDNKQFWERFSRHYAGFMRRSQATYQQICKAMRPRIISLIDNKSDISRLRDARDTIAVGQQGQVLMPPVEPQGYFKKSPSP